MCCAQRQRKKRRDSMTSKRLSELDPEFFLRAADRVIEMRGLPASAMRQFLRQEIADEIKHHAQCDLAIRGELMSPETKNA